MSNRYSVLLKKFSVPVLFSIAGLSMLFIAINKDQEPMFYLAAGLMTAAAALSILFSMGKLKSKLAFGVGGATGVIALFTVFLFYKGCQTTVTHQNNYDQCKNLAIQNLQDIRDIQKIYHEQNLKYLSNWADLEDFVTNGSIEYIIAEGTVPARHIDPLERDFLYSDNPVVDYDMTEIEAWKLSKWEEGPFYNQFSRFKRDTVQKSLLKIRFTENRAYKENRTVSGLPDFDVTMLKYIPFTDNKEEWLLESKDSVNIGEAFVATVKVSGSLPLNYFEDKKEKEMIWFGNLLTNSISGSWEE